MLMFKEQDDERDKNRCIEQNIVPTPFLVIVNLFFFFNNKKQIKTLLSIH